MHKNRSIAVGAALIMALAGCADDSEPAGAAITAAAERSDKRRSPLGPLPCCPGRPQMVQRQRATNCVPW